MLRKADPSLTYIAQEISVEATVVCEALESGERWTLEVGGEPVVSLGESREEAMQTLLNLLEAHRRQSKA